MSSKAIDTESIERYLDGQMEEEEKIRFEQQMWQNARLAREVALHRDIRKGIDLFGHTDLKEKLKQSDQGSIHLSDRPKSDNGRRLYTWVAVAASLSTIILLGYLLLVNKINDQALVDAYYTTYPNVLSPLNRSSSDTDNALKQALYAYEGGQYQQAIRLFERNESQMTKGYRFYEALSYFEAGEPERTAALLDQVIEQKDSLFYFPALWYQALAYLKTNHIAQAKENLTTLTREATSYHEKASALLDELD